MIDKTTAPVARIERMSARHLPSIAKGNDLTQKIKSRMLRSGRKLKLTAIVLLCGAAASAQPAPDSIKLENEFIRVLFLTDQPRTKTPLHEHLNDGRLTVALDDVELKVTTQGAEDRTATLTAGQSSWSTGPVVHAAQSNRTVELIVAELK